MRRLALTVALVAASCGVAIPPPTLAVPLGTNDFGEYALLVYDDSGLVTGGLAEALPAFGTSGIVASPERQELHVAWTGGACSHRPTLRVSGTSASLRLEVANPMDPQLPFVPISCPAVGIPFGLTLSLSEPVGEDAVTLEVSH